MRLTTRHAQKLLALGLTVAVGIAIASATATATRGGRAAPPAQAFWSRCSVQVRLSGFVVLPVEVSRLSCVQAKRAIARARVLISPGGPIFSTRGYRCQSKRILPRVDPSPSQLPAAEFCRDGRHRLSFVWDYAN